MVERNATKRHDVIKKRFASEMVTVLKQFQSIELVSLVASFRTLDIPSLKSHSLGHTRGSRPIICSAHPD